MRGVRLLGVLASTLLCTTALAAHRPWQGRLLEEELTLEALSIELVLPPATGSVSVVAWAQGMDFDGLDLGESGGDGEPDVSDLEDDDELELDLVPLVPLPVEDPKEEVTDAIPLVDPPPADSGGSVLGTWWFWTIVGVLAAGSGATVVALSGPEIIVPSGTLGTLDTR